MIKVKITLTSTSMWVRVLYNNDLSCVLSYLPRLSVYDYKWDPYAKRKKRVAVATYAIRRDDTNQYGFSRSEYDDFLHHLRVHGIYEEHIEITHIDTPRYGEVEFGLPGISPRDNQVPALEYLSQDAHIRTLPLPTGQGKTLTTLMHISNTREKPVFFSGARHIKTWLRTLKEQTDLKNEDIVVVKGAASLCALMHLAIADELHSKVILITNTTFNNYLKEYFAGTAYSKADYPIDPFDFCKILKITTVVTDEAHEEFLQVLRRTISLRAYKYIFLSATLNPHDELKRHIYKGFFDLPHAFKEFKQNTHTDVCIAKYSLIDKDIDQSKFETDKGYSHIMFEKWVMGLYSRENRYFDMVFNVLQKDYLMTRKEGTKCLVFFTMREMVLRFKKYLTSKIPNIAITEFLGGYDDKLFNEYEIIVTTLKSCGTGKDIPNLTVNILTQAIGSSDLSTQVQGRTRPVKLYPDINPRFWILSCDTLVKHRSYEHGHMTRFANKSNTVKQVYLSNTV